MIHVPCAEVAVAGFLVAFFPGGNKGVKPHVFRAVYPFGFMCNSIQLSLVYVSVAATKSSMASFLICFTIAKSFDEYNLYVFELGNFCHFVN